MKTYETEDLFKTREDKIDGDGPWIWIKSDSGAWDGPKTDWEVSHLNMLKKYVKNWNVVFQSGGNQGMYPALLSQLFQVVYTFEPDPLNFHCLVNNCQKDSIVKINAALAETNKMIHVKRDVAMDNTGQHTVHDGGYIPALTIDSFFPEVLDLIYLDIEGYELNALRGALRNIEKFKPVIFAERGDTYEIRELLAPFGYKVRESSVSDTIYTVDD